MHNRLPQLRHLLFVVVLCLSFFGEFAYAQTTAFTYQGKLTENGSPADGNYDFQFRLFDMLSDGTQQGTTETFLNATVASGVFTVQLDFGACASCFNGAPRFLDISVRIAGGGAYQQLAPRQAITANPYAIKSLNAATADGLSVSCVSCVTSNQIQSVNGSTVGGMIPVASVPAGSGNYIQNQNTSAQAGDFKIDGAGTANILNAETQYNLNGLRVFTVNGASLDGSTTFTASNTFTGDGAGLNTTPAPSLTDVSGKFNSFYGAGAGQANTTGYLNSFFGTQAGKANTTGFNNDFFGYKAGNANTNGFDNAFFGTFAGGSNTTGSLNAFFGLSAGFSNTTGILNSFFGVSSGNLNTTGYNNAFFGTLAGQSNTTGYNNAFFGTSAGQSNTTGYNNAFFGFNAGESNTGNNNTSLGSFTNVGIGTNVTAVGAYASVAQSHSLVLGSISGINSCTPANDCASVKVGIGTTAPVFRLHVIDPSNAGLRVQTNVTGGTVASFGGLGAFLVDAPGIAGGRLALLENGNVGIGTIAPASRLHISGTGIIRARVDSDSNAGLALALGNQLKWSLATVTGGQFQIFNDALGSNALWITAANNFVGIGTSSPDQLLSVNGNASKAAGGGSWETFSDERLKTIHGRYTRGLNALMQLRPIRYEYKSDNALGLRGSGESIGFSAQEVEHILPEAVTHSTSGYLQINNHPILWTMLNAVKEQQAQITSQQSQLKKQTAQIQTHQRNIERQAEQIHSLHHLLNQQQRLFRRQQQHLAALQRRLGSTKQESHSRK